MSAITGRGDLIKSIGVFQKNTYFGICASFSFKIFSLLVNPIKESCSGVPGENNTLGLGFTGLLI
jgi:hypothetical protein